MTVPHIFGYFTGSPLAPVLVGNTYAVDLGKWRVHGHARFSVQWLDGHGHTLARSFDLRLAGGEAGQLVTVRACASSGGATSCVTLGLPERARTISEYLEQTCGAGRPAPPPYDPNFSFISAPALAGGWNPCRPITWAMDDFGQPRLTGPSGTSWQTLAASAVAQVAAATGATFVQAPDFDVAPTSGTVAIPSPPGVDIAVGFAAQPAGVDGRGGPTASAGQFTSSAEVELATGTWKVPRALVTLLHELGHAMGLNHPVPEPPAPDPSNEIMDPTGGRFSGYQAGDLCGLFEITWQQPCAGSAVVTLGQGTIPG